MEEIRASKKKADDFLEIRENGEYFAQVLRCLAYISSFRKSSTCISILAVESQAVETPTACV